MSYVKGITCAGIVGAITGLALLYVMYREPATCMDACNTIRILSIAAAICGGFTVGAIEGVVLAIASHRGSGIQDCVSFGILLPTIVWVPTCVAIQSVALLAATAGVMLVGLMLSVAYLACAGVLTTEIETHAQA